MAAFIFAVRSQEVVVIIIAAAIVYSALFLALRGFDQDDRAMIKDVLRGMTKKGKEGNN
jgi:hypothetical protein